MSLSGAAIRYLSERGMSMEDIAELADIVQEGFTLPVPAYDPRAKKRERDAARMREKRAKESTVAATSRDVASKSSVSPKPPSSQKSTHPLPPSGEFPSQRRKATKRAPDDWSPAETTIVKLQSEGHTAGDLERALTRMRDHQFAQAHTDWDAAFRNWVRRDKDRQPRLIHERPDPLQRKRDQLDSAFSGFEAATRQRALERAGG